MPEQEVRAEEVPQAVAPTVSAPEPVSEPRPDPGMLYQQLHYAGSRLRTSVNAEKYTLQLLMLSSSDAAAQVKEMIVRDEYLDHKNQLRILRKQSLPTALFVFYGLYNTEEEAKQALESLPLFLRKHHPYVLPVKEALRKTAYLYE
jgi:septal ring-binding cell division protein DamX